MERQGAPKGPKGKRAKLLGAARNYLPVLVCVCCLIGAAGRAVAASAADARRDAANIPTAATIGTAHQAAQVIISPPPAKVPLTVVGTRVALKLKIGGQELLLGLDSCKEGLRLFASGTSACSPTAVEHQQQQQKKQQKQKQKQRDSAGRREEAKTPLEQQEEERSPLEQQKQQQNCYDSDLSSSCLWCLNLNEVCTAFSDTSFTCRASKHRDPKFAARYKQIVDGIVVAEVRLEGLETVELSWPSFTSSHQGSASRGGSIENLSSVSSLDESVPPSASLLLNNFPVKLVLERDTEFDAFRGLDGVWGIAGPDLCCREASFWNILLQPHINAVGFDINLPPSTSAPQSLGSSQRASHLDIPSFVHFGADPGNIFGEMLWAERIQTGAAGFDGLMHFSTYEWTLCGEHIGHPLSNTWEAIVDLSSECMVVPPPLWRSFRSWLPLDTAHELCKDPDSDDDVSKSSVSAPVALKGDHGKIVYRRTCPLNKSARRPLPSVSFSLSQSSSEGPRIQIPLEQLVIHEEGIGEVLCIVPQPFLSVGAEQWRQIRFGTRVLSALNVVMDRLNWRMGLKEKNPQPSSDASCPSRAACIGEQMYVPYTNRCADPDCSVKILFDLNEDTKVCELAWWVPGAVVTAVAALVALELFVLHLRKKVVAEACSGGQ